jgi:hypothetical protein
LRLIAGPRLEREPGTTPETAPHEKAEN